MQAGLLCSVCPVCVTAWFPYVLHSEQQLECFSDDEACVFVRLHLQVMVFILWTVGENTVCFGLCFSEHQSVFIPISSGCFQSPVVRVCHNNEALARTRCVLGMKWRIYGGVSHRVVISPRWKHVTRFTARWASLAFTNQHLEALHIIFRVVICSCTRPSARPLKSNKPTYGRDTGLERFPSS